MNTHYRDTRKMDPARGATLGDTTPNDADRVEIGPTRLAFDEWAVAVWNCRTCKPCAATGGSG